MMDDDNNWYNYYRMFFLLLLIAFIPFRIHIPTVLELMIFN